MILRNIFHTHPTLKKKVTTEYILVSSLKTSLKKKAFSIQTIIL
jgi:hypothetical protein